MKIHCKALIVFILVVQSVDQDAAKQNFKLLDYFSKLNVKSHLGKNYLDCRRISGKVDPISNLELDDKLDRIVYAINGGIRATYPKLKLSLILRCDEQPLDILHLKTSNGMLFCASETHLFKYV